FRSCSHSRYLVCVHSFPTRRSSDLVIVVDLDGGHHLAFGGERDLAHLVEAPAALFVQAELAFGDQEGGFGGVALDFPASVLAAADRKSTRLNSSHVKISYAVFCLNK